MDNIKKLSVIVPVYNTEKYLVRCIESIINQSYKDIYLILIDDGSTDKSSDICDYYAKEYDNIVVRHTTNSGLSRARNLGISLVSTEYLGFIDSDDWIEKYMFEKLIFDAYQNNADISACNMYTAFSNTNKREKNEMTGFSEDVLIFKGDDVLKNFYKLFSVCNKIFKTKLFENVKFPDNKIFEDARTTYRLANLAEIATFNKYNGYNYFQREDSIIGKMTNEKMYDRVLVWNEIGEIVLSRIPEEYNYIIARKDRAILEALTKLSSEKNEFFDKLIDEIIIPENNPILSESERNKIMKLLK